MSVTLSQLIDDVEHASRSSMDARLDPKAIVNEAGQHLFSMHSWGWRLRPKATLDFVADQPYVDLPSDFGFGEIVTVNMSNSLVRRVYQTTVSNVEFMRSLINVASPIHFRVAAVYPTQANATSAPGPARLQIYPTPVSNESDAIEVVYLSGWVILTNLTDVANVPARFATLLRRVAREFSIGYSTGNWAGLDKLEQSQFYTTLKRSDGAAQSEGGYIHGGVLADVTDMGSPDPNWNFTTQTP